MNNDLNKIGLYIQLVQRDYNDKIRDIDHLAELIEENFGITDALDAVYDYYSAYYHYEELRRKEYYNY